MHELIYAGKDVETVVLKRYPNAKIEDASDEIHKERFELEVDVNEDEFYVFAIVDGYANDCFGFQLLSRNIPPGSCQKVWDWFAEAKAIMESEEKETVK